MACLDPLGHAVKGEGLRPLASWVCMFESRRGIDISVLSVGCFQIEISGTGRSLDERYPTEYSVS